MKSDYCVQGATALPSTDVLSTAVILCLLLYVVPRSMKKSGYIRP